MRHITEESVHLINFLKLKGVHFLVINYYFLVNTNIFCRKTSDYLSIPILFVTFVASFSWMASREMLAAKSGDWQYLLARR